jgi:hypothetical protein
MHVNLNFLFLKFLLIIFLYYLLTVLYYLLTLPKVMGKKSVNKAG